MTPVPARCPNGHTDRVQIRVTRDYPAMFDADSGTIAPKECATPGEIDEPIDGGTEGVDCGVWCPTCDRWFTETEVSDANRTREHVSSEETDPFSVLCALVACWDEASAGACGDAWDRLETIVGRARKVIGGAL